MKLKTLLLPNVIALSLLAVKAQPAHAWWPQGHSIIAEAAVRSLNVKSGAAPAVAKTDPIPGYFRDGNILIAHTAQDPDLVKNEGLPHITDSETPEHFLDFELMDGHALPDTRSQFERLCTQLHVNPNEVGYLPYAIAEWTERLTMAFAEYRRYPHNSSIQTKSLVYAGMLSHYTADLCMPLHTTINYDGRALPNGKSPHTGIHAKVDALIERLQLQPKDLAAKQQISAVPELMPGILAEFDESRSHVEQTYNLEKVLPAGRTSQPSKEVIDFTTERAREATRFTASIFLTAWRDSAKIQLPDWLEREK